MKTKSLIIVLFLSLILFHLSIFDSFLNSKVGYDGHKENIRQIDDDPKKEAGISGIEMQDISVISSESLSFSIQPDLAIDSYGNLHAVWYDYTDFGGSGTDKDIFYKKREATTGIWSTTEIVSTESSNSSETPKIYVDPSDNIHVIWNDYTMYNGAGADSDIFYKKKDATTGIWSPTELVSAESTETSSSPSFVVDQSGYVYVVWMDDTNYASCGNDWDIFFKFRRTTGVWILTQIVSTESNIDSNSPSLKIDSNRNLHLAWMDNLDTGGDIDIYYRTRDIFTGEWTEIEIISEESNDFSLYPSLTVDINDNLHVVWQDREDYNLAGSDTDIFYKRKESSTKVWTTAEVISTESINTSESADIWVTPSGGVHVAWKDRTPLGELDIDSDIFYKYLAPSVEDWSATHIISAELPSVSPSLVGDIAGNIHLLWQAQYPNLNWDIFYRKLTHDLTNPVIQIESPSINQQFGEIAPIYKIIVEESHLKSISYVINNGPAYNIEDLMGVIDQNAWENTPNGFISLKFIAEDHNGNIGEEEVIIIKEDPAISQELEINILSPIMNQEFKQYAPAFEISIEGIYDSIWYTLEEGGTEVIVTDFKGFIDQDLWDIFDNGYISLQFYTNNSLGTIYHDEVYILKNPILEVSLINLAYSTELFELTVSVCDSKEQSIEDAQFEIIWGGTPYTENIESIGPGLYRILLSPIFIQPEESPVPLECIISAKGYTKVHYKTYISIYSSEEPKKDIEYPGDSFNVFAALAGVVSLLAVGMCIAIVPKHIIKKRKLK